MSDANYQYILDLAERHSNVDNPRMLDFGCGYGKLIKYALERNIDICGADTFHGIYENWEEKAHKEGGGIHKIENNKLPFADNSFDIVLSNFVFEHIKDYKESFEEIHRVLKVRGTLVALFPVHETFYEGHVCLYFPHYLSHWPRLQRAYMHLFCCLGLSASRKQLTPSEWAKSRQEILRNDCFYHPLKEIIGDMSEIWNLNPEFHQQDYIVWRLKNNQRLSFLAPLFAHRLLRPVVEFICLKRAGVVLSISKQSTKA